MPCLFGGFKYHDLALYPHFISMLLFLNCARVTLHDLQVKVI